MRFYPTLDGKNYAEIPPCWSLYCHNPNITWKPEQYESKHFISYWRDLEGQKLPYVLKKDLQIEGWTETRIRKRACLPLCYSVGNRFIRLETAPPANFKCTTLPMNLTEVRKINAHERKLAKEAKKKKKLEKKLAKNSGNKNLRRKR